MNEQSFCTNCGALLPDAARHCPRCGGEAPVAIPPGMPVQQAPDDRPVPPPAIEQSGGAVPEGRRSLTWLLVPLVIAVLAGLTLAILSRMPFGGRQETQSRVSAREPQQPPSGSGRIVELDPDDPRLRPSATDTVAPPPATVPPQERTPAPSQESAAETDVSESDASASLLDYIQSNDVYGIDSSCLGVRSLGFENAGYTFEATDQCEGTRSLGKWRVDATNGDIYRQRPDGRYLAP